MEVRTGILGVPREERGSVVVKALCYKPVVAGVRDPLRLFFYIYLILSAALGPGVNSDSNRNEYR
jgi:hypothetical protein